MLVQSMPVQGEQPLVEVAEACGFRHLYHFDRVFKRSMGISPTAWLRSELSAAPGVDLHYRRPLCAAFRT
jgi:AraC-like DNA-binding protein